MNRLELAENFAEELEIERNALGLTQQQMADVLDLNVQAYKRIISGETAKIEVYTSYKLYQLTGKLAYEYVRYFDKYVDTYTKLKRLDDSEIEIINSMIDYMLSAKQKSIGD